MSPSSRHVIAVAAVSLLALFGVLMFAIRVAARCKAAPAMVAEKSHVVDTDHKTEIEAHVSSTVADYGPVAVTTKTHRHTAKPDGTKEDVETETRTETGPVKIATAATLDRKAEETRTVTVIQERRVEVRVQPRWLLGAQYGRALNGSQRYGATAGMRVVGPLWATLAVDIPTKAATIGVQVAW